MNVEWIIVLIIAGIALAAIGAHPKFCNLALPISIFIGFIAGVISACIYVIIALFTTLSTISTYILSIILLGIIGGLIIIGRFFRNPERTPPKDMNVILSPADGEIIYVRKIDSGVVPCSIKGKRNITISEIAKTPILENCNGYIIGICMTIHDVHVTRAPIAGKLIFYESFAGKTISPKNWESEIYNPRTSLIFESDMGKYISVTELGTPYVSKILTFIQKGDKVSAGQRIGKITFGSQVDIIIPNDNINIIIKEKDRVIAGETILAKTIEN